MTDLYLIRHGQAYSQLDAYEGADAGHQVIVGGMRGDRGLTPVGRAQAEHLRDRLAATGEIHADIIYASTLPRARETAAIVAPALGVSVTLDDDIQELRPGEADGMALDEAEARFGVPDFRRDPYRPISPGGENWPEFMLRVGTALDRITRAHPDQTVVLFTHGGVVDASFNVFFFMHTLKKVPNAFETFNTSITHWAQTSRAGTRRWRLMRYNDDLHARDIGAPERIRWTCLRARSGEAAAVRLPTEDLPVKDTAV